MQSFSANGIQSLQQHNEFEENLLMDDLDIDELLECEDVEQTAFISSSKQLLSVIDNVINCIDDRINYKKHSYYGNFYGFQGEDFGPGTNNVHFNNNLYGYHKHQSQSTSLNHFNPSMNANAKGRNNVGADGFDKTRKISVLY